jgi:hypothetical protein
MKSRKKMKFRIGVLCLIALFILLPYLSSPVAATVIFQNIGAISDNTPGGPTVAYVSGGSYKSPGSYNVNDDTSGVITFNCDCFQKDSNSGGQGSVHYMELNVQQIIPSPGSLLTTYIYRELNPGQTASPYPTILSITTTYSSIGDVFSVYVYAEVTDNATQNSAWNTYYWTVTII